MAAAVESTHTPTSQATTPLVHIKCKPHDSSVHSLKDKQHPWRSVASYTSVIYSSIEPAARESEQEPVTQRATPFSSSTAAMSSYRINHRRVSSLPPTPDMSRDHSEDDDSELSMDVMMLGHEEDMNTSLADESSVFSGAYTATPINVAATKTNEASFFIDVGELLHSPSTNRRSVSVFQFDDFEESRQADYKSSEPHGEEGNMSILGKMHNASSSSTESLREDQRTWVLNELLQTERRYVASLELILSVFLSSVEKIIAPRDLRLLFPCQLEPLIILHRDLLSRLTERIEVASRWQGVVGDVFGRICTDQEGEFVALYSAYMNEFKIALQTLVHYEKTSQFFCKTISDCSQRPECEGLSLASFLLTPIQRLPRYEMLLKSLLKHTSQDHPDCYYIESALNALHSNLVLLDHSIQVCQLASSIRKDDNRSKRGNKKTKRKPPRRYHSLRFTEKIRRHFSQTNIDDLTSPSHSPPLQERGYQSRGNSALGKSSHLARSVANLLEEKDKHKDESKVNNSYLNRAISFSDVLLLGSDDKVLEEQPTASNKTLMSHSPSLISHDDSIEEEETREGEEGREEAPRNMILNTHRASIYSSNSSTSGFDSIAGDYSYGQDDSGTLKHTYPTGPALSSYGNVSTLRPLQSLNSTDSGYRDDNKHHQPPPPPPPPPMTSNPSVSAPSSEKTKAKLRKKTSFSAALKVLKRATSKDTTPSSSPQPKRSQSMGHLNKIEIGEPTDFRHIEHKMGNKQISVVL